MIDANEARNSAIDRENAVLIARMNRIESAIKQAVAKGKTKTWVPVKNSGDVARLYTHGYVCRLNWFCRIFGGCIVSWEATK